MVINTFNRYQIGLTLQDLFPKIEGLCACGCQRKVSGKKKWFSKECQKKSLYHFYIVKGDVKVIRDLLFSKQEGFCQACGVFDENWQADHIIPVFKGGGGCSLDNFQTLCLSCHKEKSRQLYAVPYGINIFTSSYNVIGNSFDTIRTGYNIISKDIIRQAEFVV